MSSPHTRIGTASSDKKQSYITLAIISVPYPLVCGASCVTMRRPVFCTEATTKARSHGCNVRRSINSHDIPSACAISAALPATYTCEPYVTIVTSLPLSKTLPFPKGNV